MSGTTMHMFSCSCEPPLPHGHDRPIGGRVHFGKVQFELIEVRK